MVTKTPNPSKSASKLLLLILLGTFCSQTLSVRMSSNSKFLSSSSSSSDSSLYVLSSVFPSALNFGCVDISNATDAIEQVVSDAAGANSITASIIDFTVSKIAKAVPKDHLNACLGNFAASYITGSISECSSMLLPSSSEYSILSFAIPLPGGICTAEPSMTTASFCLAIGEYNGLPSVSIQANSGTLSCLATAAGSGIGYIISTAIDAGLNTVSVGVSLTSSFVKSTTLYTGSIQTVEITGNYYDFINIGINTTKFGLPDIVSITGSATRVISVFDDAATWVSKLTSSKSFKDAITLFESFSMLISIELDFTLSLGSKTLGFLPDLGPYTLGLANLYATTTSSTLASGQTLGAGLYVYVAANNIIEEVISDLISEVINKVGGILNTILSDFGISITTILDKLSPKASSSSNVFAFLIDTQQISVLVQTSLSAITTIIPSGGPISLQCYYNYASNKGSCQLKLGSINKFFTALISGAAWVIKEASAFFDETGSTIAFAEKSLGAFTDKALQTSANAIKSGALTVEGYASECATWAEKAIYQCGSEIVTSAAECGYETIKDGTICGYDTVTDCIKDIFEWKSCKEAKSCKTAAKCTVATSC